MIMRDIVRRSLRSLGNAKIRTTLTALAIGVGALTLTATFAASKGASEYTNDLIASNFDPAEIFVAKDKKLFGANGFNFGPQEYDPGAIAQGGVTITQLNLEDVQVIEMTENVESVRREYQLNPEFITREGQKRYTGEVNVYSPSQVPELAAGSLNTSLKDDELILSDAYVSLLGFKDAEAAIGEEVSLVFRRTIQVNDQQIQDAFLNGGVEAVQNLRPFEERTEKLTVKAVSKKAATALSADTALKVSAAKAEELAQYLTAGTDRFQKYPIVYAKIKNGDDPTIRAAVAADLENRGYNVQTVEETQQALLQFITILTGIVLGFGILVLIASIFGIVNTQYISVLERTREIGLNKALGMSRAKVALLFLMEAALIGFIGGSFGAGVAVLLGVIFNPLLSSTLGLNEGQYLLIFEPLTVVAVVMLLTFVAMAAGLLPALKAAKLNPIDALRTE